jgi:ribonuclease D
MNPPGATAELAAAAREQGRLAIDTEFISEGRYQPLLCLAQVAVGERTEVLDPLDGPLDPSPVADTLADPAVEIVVHAGRQDVAILRRTWETDVRNVFDTQVAAGFLGLGTQEGYARLVKRVLGVDVHGAEGFTRWDRRPLTDDQLKYAKEDAANLLALGSALEDRLEQRGRLEWAREECRALERSSDVREPESLYARLPKVASLKAEQRAVARELVDWREATARKADRAATSIMSDQTLVEIARRRPVRRDDLEQIRGLPAQTLHRRHAELLDAVRRGQSREAPPAPERRPPPDSRDAPLVALSQALVRHRALEEKLSTELIATQADLTELVSAIRRGDGEPDVRVLQGWRRELVGDQLLGMLDGRASLSVGDDHRLQVRTSDS